MNQRPSRLREVKQTGTVLYVPNVHGGQPYNDTITRLALAPGQSMPNTPPITRSHLRPTKTSADIITYVNSDQAHTIGMRRPKSKTYIDDPRLDARHLFAETVHRKRVEQRLDVAVTDSVRGGLRLDGFREVSAKSSRAEPRRG